MSETATEKHPGWPKGVPRPEKDRRKIAEARRAQEARRRRILELARELTELLNKS